MSIKTQIDRLLKIPSRLRDVTQAYVVSLLRDSGRRTLQAAAALSGLNPSQFSRFLSGHKELALENLDRLLRRQIKRALAKSRALVTGAPWRVALIIDATLHERSSRHLDNAQRFNHGQGWVIGHQWTNLVLVINDQTIPLPPIPFLTTETCKKLKQPYLTEAERIIVFLSQWNWQRFLPGVDPEEIVVLSDSGYDNKSLQNFFLTQGWDFIGSLKKSRSVKTQTQGWQSVEALFRDTRKIGPWQTVRHETNGGKNRRSIRLRSLLGSLKGVRHEVRLISSQKPNKERLHLACSKKDLSPGAITRAYKLRWRVEIFHREVKSYLGFEDAGLTQFEAIHAHVLWVYCTYLLLFAIGEQDNAAGGILARRRHFEMRLRNEEIGKILKANARFDSKRAVIDQCLQVRQGIKAA